jgi:hypothetical protein
MISNRLFELRVHAFKWTDNWKVQKRMGDPKKIAWNFHNGGTFININNPNKYSLYHKAIDISKKVLDISGMDFGAVDFIVDNKHKLYFLEINSAPGFTNLSNDIYFKAFESLFSINIIKYSGGLVDGKKGNRDI